MYTYFSEQELLRLKEYWDRHPCAKRPWTRNDKHQMINANGGKVPVEALLVEDLLSASFPDITQDSK